MPDDAIAKDDPNADEAATVLLILGMKGNGCREVVASALEAVRSVREVHVSLYRSLAVVKHSKNCRANDLIAAVVDVGFGASLTSIRPSSSLLELEDRPRDRNE